MLTTEHGYSALLELAGILQEHTTCQNCGCTNSAHKIMGDIIDTFGNTDTPIKVPKLDAIKQITNTIQLWQAVVAYAKTANVLPQHLKDYATKYDLDLSYVTKTYTKANDAVNRFVQLRATLKG